MGVKNVVKRIGAKAGDKVAKLAALSPEQVAQVQLQRENYLLEKPDPTDEMARIRTERMMAASSVEIFNAFLPQIKEIYLPVDKDAEYDMPFNADYNIAYFNITKWVTDKKENNLEKLVNVYAVLSNEDCNIALVFNRTQKKTNVYLAVVNTNNADNRVDVDIYKNRLIDAIRGNFPGAEWQDEGIGILPCLKNEKAYSVASASNIPTEKSEKFVSQTIEKLLDGIVPDSNKKEYTIILLATPIKDVEERKLKLGEFYSGMAPYASWQTDFHLTDSNSIGSSATVGVNVGASAGIQNGQNYATTQSNSQTASNSKTETESQSHTQTDSEATAESSSDAHTEGVNSNETQTKGSSDNVGINGAITAGVSESATVGGGIVPASASVSANQSATIGGSYQHGWNRSIAESLGKTASDTITKGISNTISKSVAETTGTAVANTLGKAVTTAMAKTAGTMKSASLGANFGANFARSSNVTATVGKSEGITQSFTNYNIKHALELLENQMKRLEQSTALGMWDFAAYVLSEDQNVANNVAHSYLALTQGEDSYMSKSAINLWKGNVEEEKNKAKVITDYLRELRHPVFAINPGIINTEKYAAFEQAELLEASGVKTDFAYKESKEYQEYLQYKRSEEYRQHQEFLVYPPIVTATTSLSGKELAYSLNFPQKAVSGLPILECAEFGRNVVTYECDDDTKNEISLGNIFHMNHVEQNRVRLAKKSLASHTFITGSTGSGKSNTVYQIIRQARKNDVKFLVVEPAKGEYKSVFGMQKDVFVYGTNPELTKMLRINPFSFPKGIHVLEHLDRLVEIFNVCWPMYAAMPAVLKNAVEKSYQDCGWNLSTSENMYGEELYPSFTDVACNVKAIIDSSEYDSDNKGAYKGALLTRLESLTNGLNGMIFVQDEIRERELFDENVIVDLSRVGSSETKSLIMGMLVLKLQEYRMTSAEEINAELKHLTVLEEAHNILRRTSIEQSSEGANLLGKSVEMLANAIAEMRTYGEGFVIADQAPGLLDMSVIRNTNTKIIMRLPDQSDRELVGKAANLNEDQITELAKLPCGVAAVYQNEWVQPVLCKVDKYSKEIKPYSYTMSDEDKERYESAAMVSESLLDFIMNKEIFRKDSRSGVEQLKTKIIKSKLDTVVKRDFLEYLAAEKENAVEALRTLIFDFLDAEDAIRKSTECDNITDWVRSVVKGLNPSIEKYSNKQIDLVLALLIYEQSIRDASYNNILCRFTEVYKNEGGVF